MTFADVQAAATRAGHAAVVGPVRAMQDFRWSSSKAARARSQLAPT